MPCTGPLKGYRARAVNPDTGRRPIVFDKKDALVDLPVTLPCGRCAGCRLERSRVWAVRCMHEAQMYDENAYVTLTYRDEDLPFGGQLVIEDFQKFMKRLRKVLPQRVKVFYCGEYGEEEDRPHWHAILFNVGFRDKVFFKYSNGIPLFTSDFLSAKWGMGHCTVGDVTFESAAYVARYTTKKITGDMAYEHYRREVVVPETGEVREVHRRPEFAKMSQGIGFGWWQKYGKEVYPDDFIVMNGYRMKVPKFYDRKLEVEDKGLYREIKGRRIRRAKERADDNTEARLLVKKQVIEGRLKLLPRKLRSED